ncbi:MAG: 1-acyl-sn-glycerol-3-phosphate acyltransferase [Spirochaetaceae bacterium]|nr:MAG: 1-acyl-sn-glycerol-3-phosphate acyltransferase [Spirochaetaceae bacterium]
MNIWKRAAQWAGLFCRRVKGLSFLGRLCNRLVILGTGALVRIESTSPASVLPKRVLFAANHSSAADGFLIPCFLMSWSGHVISFFIHWMYKYIPFVGWIMGLIDPVWVYNRGTKFKWIAVYKKTERDNPVEEAMKKMERGNSIGIFPEGTRNKDPEKLLRGRLGTGELVLATGVEVVPVGIDFPARIKNGKIPRLGRTVIRIGAPISFEAEARERERLLSDTSLPERERRMKLIELFGRVTNQVMQAISTLCGRRYEYT